MKAMSIGVGLLLTAAVPIRGGAIEIAQQAPGPPTTAAAVVTQCAQAQMVVDQLLAAGMLRLDMARQSNAAPDLRAAVDSVQNTMRDARAQFAACSAAAQAQQPADPHAGHNMSAAPAPGVQPAAPAPVDHSKMPMGTAPGTKPAAITKPPASAPMDHSKMPMGTTPAKPAPAKPAKPRPSDAAVDHSKMPMATPSAAKPAPAKGGKTTAPAAPIDHSKMPAAPPTDAAAQAVDPVCGLKVDPSAAPQATHNRQTHYFCSEQHRQLFQKNPAKYLPKGK